MRNNLGAIAAPRASGETWAPLRNPCASQFLVRISIQGCPADLVWGARWPRCAVV